MFKLESHSGKKKGKCPMCSKVGTFVYYEGIPKSFNYGRCDRENNCGHHNAPTIQKLKDDDVDFEYITPQQEMTKTIVYPSTEDLSVLEDLNSTFHTFCRNHLKITDEHLQSWNAGTSNNRFKNTVFAFKNKDRFLNLKTLAYELTNDPIDCKRNKKMNPFYLKARENEQFKRCLYGEHLLQGDKIVCLVESEKTAVIGSFFYPQFDFLSTGGASGMKAEQLTLLKGKTVYYLPDNDKAGKENSIINHLQESKINIQIINFPTAKEGDDLADLIIKGERPEIKPQLEVPAMKPSTETETKSNTFTLLRDYLLATWDFRLNVVRNEMEYKFVHEPTYVELNQSDVWVNLKENSVQFKKDDFNAILGSSIMEQYDPIKEYFINLPEWNQKTDHIEKLCSYLLYTGNICLKNHFKKWLVRSVKCAIDNNYFNKQIFVLIGKQNDGKSTFVRFLAPQELEKYYTENPDFRNKDGEIALTQNFIINMDELANIGRQDTDKLKTFISKVNTNVRRPFERNTKTESRRASFMGTTNNDEFLSDHTGNVRWLNFKIEGIDFNYSVEMNINDVWSQAYYLYKSGYDCEISKEEMIEIEENNRDFKIQTEEMQIIKEYIKAGDSNSDNLEYLTTLKIKEYLETKNVNYRTISIVKLGKALANLGFKKESRRIEGFIHPVKAYLICKM